MSDDEFERPGDGPRPVPDHWPYHVPTPEDPPSEDFLDASPSLPPASGRVRSRLRFLATAALGVLIGAVGGGLWVGMILRDPPEPEPIPITVDTFPRELLGEQRNDIALRDAGFAPTVARLDAEFEDQLPDYRFAYGGDGATLGYGRILELTIVNGILPPALPRGSARNRDGKVTQTLRLISLRAGNVSCTFEPLPVLDWRTSLEEAGDFTSDGLTNCVLVDGGRNLSLRLAQDRVEPDAGAIETSASFRDELERLHTRLAG